MLSSGVRKSWHSRSIESYNRRLPALVESNLSGTEGRNARVSVERQSPRRGFGRLGVRGRWVRAILPMCFGLLCSTAAAGDLEEAEKLFRAGQYDECAKAVEVGIENNPWREPWRYLKIRTELVRGRDAEAIAAAEEALQGFPASISLHLLASQIYRKSGHTPEAAVELDTLARLIQNSPRQYSTAEGLVTIGRFFVMRGADAQGARPVL